MNNQAIFALTDCTATTIALNNGFAYLPPSWSLNAFIPLVLGLGNVVCADGSDSLDEFSFSAKLGFVGAFPRAKTATLVTRRSRKDFSTTVAHQLSTVSFGIFDPTFARTTDLAAAFVPTSSRFEDSATNFALRFTKSSWPFIKTFRRTIKFITRGFERFAAHAAGQFSLRNNRHCLLPSVALGGQWGRAARVSAFLERLIGSFLAHNYYNMGGVK